MYYQVYSFSLFVCYILVGVGATESALESAPIQDFAKGLPPFQPEEKMLICLDYDGTLKPQQPGELTAEERRESFQTLQTLANNPNYHVYIISARPFKNLKDEFGEIEGLKLGGSYGVELGSTASDEPVVIFEHPQIKELRRCVKQVFNQEGEWKAFTNPMKQALNFDAS
ncbi:hypothetical protein O181_008414 [Austropuccinia psidii MF-1]|uniref:Trehalose-phosphatase n=1 Tax=Austropuccinia psidii MF-1 TaxID=1389203 RepID=A0A9Q3GIU6_9BASI|nr:hypothetical protein [Austropuccinia psidii MF-1]